MRPPGARRDYGRAAVSLQTRLSSGGSGRVSLSLRPALRRGGSSAPRGDRIVASGVHHGCGAPRRRGAVSRAPPGTGRASKTLEVVMEPVVLLMLRVDAGRPRRCPVIAGPASSQQGDALPGRSAERRGDRAGHVSRRRSPGLRMRGLRDVACRVTDQRGARPGRATLTAVGARSSCATAMASIPARWVWTRGDGSCCAHGSPTRPDPLGPLFSVIDRRTRGRPLTPTGVRQHLRRTAEKSMCAHGSCRTSCVTRTRSRWPRHPLSRGRGTLAETPSRCSAASHLCEPEAWAPGNLKKALPACSLRDGRLEQHPRGSARPRRPARR